VSQAFDLLYYTERVAQVQLLAMSSGRQLKFLPDDVIEATLAAYRNGGDYGGRPPHDWHFAALKRILEKREPDYKD
jgi:ribulose-5-phosphate 4-epimerase/fuculose-1-phosphate aldolase